LGRLPEARKTFVLIALMILQSQVFSQHISRNNFTGKWEDPGSWEPTWPVPETDSIRDNIVVYGYITTGSSVSFSNRNNSLVVNDTLVIDGDLSLSNLNGLEIADNGILIILGSLLIDNRTTLRVDGYFIIKGDVIKKGSFMQGLAESNDNPPKVFIGGNIAESISDAVLYPVFDKVNPSTIPFPSSGFAFGDMTDLRSDAIFSFFESIFIHNSDIVKIPNVITPNSDGVNDVLTVEGLEGSVRLIIINKWGGVEADFRNYSNDWDGRNHRGQELPADTYFFIIDNGKGLVRKGSVLILR
jgi:gliding motility-associated-like protein